MKDLLGNEVSVGDAVVIASTCYRGLTPAVVKKITPKGIKAEWKTGSKYRPTEETYRASNMFVKVADDMSGVMQ